MPGNNISIIILGLHVQYLLSNSESNGTAHMSCMTLYAMSRIDDLCEGNTRPFRLRSVNAFICRPHIVPCLY